MLDKSVPSSLDIFNVVKVVIFMETSPLTDKFEQIVFTHEQFKKISKAIEDCMPQHPSGEGITLTTEETEAYTFPNIRDQYADTFNHG